MQNNDTCSNKKEDKLINNNISEKKINNEMNKIGSNISPLRMIRIAKNIQAKQIAEYFSVTTSYIFAVENGQKNMKIQTLKYGLDNMNISLDDYFELVKYSEILSTLSLSDTDKYTYMLIKTLGIVAPELKKNSEELLEYASAKHKK